MTQEYSDAQYERFSQEGLLNAVVKAVVQGCHTSFDERNIRFVEQRLNRRVKGNDRSVYVDQELLHIAPLFGFEEH